MKFQVGDVVTLSSGGPAMSVRETTEPDLINVDWFDKDGKLRTAQFQKNQLIPQNLSELSDEQLQFIAQRGQSDVEKAK